MCHHYRSATQLPIDFVAEFSLPTNFRILSAGVPSAAYPLRKVPALRVDADGKLAAFVPEWGLLPRWWKPSGKTPKREKFQRMTFNVRSETAAEKPTFRDATKKRRCLLPFDQFFEKDHYFGIGEPISFAGLWESWQADESEIETVTLLTTEPNAEVRGVGHHRMPVLLTTPDSRRDWLVTGADATDLEPLADGVLDVESA